MEVRGELLIIPFWLRVVCQLCVVGNLFFIHSDARNSIPPSQQISSPVNIKRSKILEVAKSLNMVMDVSLEDSSNPQPYVSSPFNLPPYDSLPPMPLPNTNNPPYCVYPPPQSSSTPIGFNPTPASIVSGPPSISTPVGPPESVHSPPIASVPNPPYYEPSPPSTGDVPSPVGYGFEPSPPVFQPPVVYPPLTGSPPGSSGGGGGRAWCVAKPSVPDPIIQEAMNYACGSGADCGPIQPNGPCYQPNSLLAHASYAFNSYWQRTRVAGGTCDFGGTAILVTMDPSNGGCHFVNY